MPKTRRVIDRANDRCTERFRVKSLSASCPKAWIVLQRSGKHATCTRGILKSVSSSGKIEWKSIACTLKLVHEAPKPKSFAYDTDEHVRGIHIRTR